MKTTGDYLPSDQQKGKKDDTSELTEPDILCSVDPSDGSSSTLCQVSGGTGTGEATVTLIDNVVLDESFEEVVLSMAKSVSRIETLVEEIRSGLENVSTEANLRAVTKLRVQWEGVAKVCLHRHHRCYVFTYS